MTYLLIASLSGVLLGWLMGFLSLFLIMLILIQRGKGGGLTGALGGPGGQSAFGSKAGDTFTVITVVVASIWAFTCAFTMWLLGAHAPTTAVTESKVKAGPGDTRPADEPVIPTIGDEAVSGLSPAAIGESASKEAADLLQLTPAENSPAESKPAESKPAESKPAESKPAESKPAETSETDASDPQPAAESNPVEPPGDPTKSE